MEIQHGVALGPRTTLELGGTAEYFVAATSHPEIAEATAFAQSKRLPLTILGGGSNCIVPDEGIAGLVLHLATRGIERRRDGDSIRVRVAAGEDWCAFVETMVAENFAGVECLAGIPGNVGATPVQNVGAYGQDVAQTICDVEVLDLQTQKIAHLDTAACQFAYRTSWLKKNPGRYVVLSVEFRLRPDGKPTRTYAELQRHTSADATLSAVLTKVLELRTRKSMVLNVEDVNRRSAGSFFTNPIVDPTAHREVVTRALSRKVVTSADGVPSWPGAEGIKLSAGWLIERAGFAKGVRDGNFGLSTKHALAIVHHGGGTTQELLAFSQRIQTAVEQTWNVRLEREPRILGVDG